MSWGEKDKTACTICTAFSLHAAFRVSAVWKKKHLIWFKPVLTADCRVHCSVKSEERQQSRDWLCCLITEAVCSTLPIKSTAAGCTFKPPHMQRSKFQAGRRLDFVRKGAEGHQSSLLAVKRKETRTTAGFYLRAFGCSAMAKHKNASLSFVSAHLLLVDLGRAKMQAMQINNGSHMLPSIAVSKPSQTLKNRTVIVPEYSIRCWSCIPGSGWRIWSIITTLTPTWFTPQHLFHTSKVILIVYGLVTFFPLQPIFKKSLNISQVDFLLKFSAGLLDF